MLAGSERVFLLERLLRRAIPWLLRQQLPTGELVTYRWHADQGLPFVCPFLSALALDALDCLDPNSDHFHERLFDLIPAPDRGRVRVAVSTLRWRLRMHLATQQEANGTWRRFGRGGTSPPCRTTTAFCLLMYLSQTLQPQRDYTRILAAMNEDESEVGVSAVLAQRLMSLAGLTSMRLSDPAVALTESSSRPMLGLWAAAQACYEEALTCEEAQKSAMRRLALQQLNERGSFRFRHKKAFGITVLNLCHDRSDAVQRVVDRAVAELLLDSEPPSQWRREPIFADACSAPVTLLLVLRSLSQAVLAPHLVEAASC